MVVELKCCVYIAAAAYVDSSDIVDHKLKLILGLIWTLILHYSISMPVWDDDDVDAAAAAAGSAGTSHSQTPKQRLLAWIQNKIPDRRITNFTSDWSDGSAIGALVDGVAPGLMMTYFIFSHFALYLSR